MKCPKYLRRDQKNIGLPPGSLVHIGDKKIENVEITLINYDEAQYQEREIKKIEECFPFKNKPAVTWININGIHDAEIMGKIGEYVGLHPLLYWKTL